MAGSEVFEPGVEPEKLWSGARWAEGPVWIPDRGVLRFSDIPGNRLLEYSEATGEVTTYREGVEFVNGNFLDLDGAVVQCSHGRRAIERDVDGDVSVLVDSWAGVRLNSPNDLVVKSDGTIWFTDPAYGIRQASEGHLGELEYEDQYVFRFDPATGEIAPVVIDVEVPNGLAFSPDESLLYVADSSWAPVDGSDPDPASTDGHSIRVYDVREGRLAKNGRVFADVTPGVPDGIRVDAAGNVWSSCADGVRVFDPSGEPIGALAVPEEVANLCFGGPDGRTLYITATTSLYRIRI